MTASTPDRGVACAQWSRAQEIDLVGTAGSYRGYVLVEWPLPWPRDPSEIPQLEPVLRAVEGMGFRMQLLVPASDTDRRIAVYRRPEGAFSAFGGRELRLPVRRRACGDPDDAPDGAPDDAGALGDAALELLAGGGTEIGTQEVLICTHGRRDRCCGSLGMDIWQQVRAWPADGATAFARTSHTGGHRFAPTCIVLPEGTLWGRLSADALDRIVRRAGPLDDLVPCYRGCSAIGSPAGQALERAVLAEIGWELFEHARHGEDLGEGRVRLTLSGPGLVGDDEPSVWEATVVSGRTHRLPDCGKALELATKTQTDLVVVGLTRTA